VGREGQNGTQFSLDRERLEPLAQEGFVPVSVLLYRVHNLVEEANIRK
jgi:hypothetical protein